MIFETQHKVFYQGRKFTKNGMRFTYLRADFYMGESIIVYKDMDDKAHSMYEKDFFSKVTKEQLLYPNHD